MLLVAQTKNFDIHKEESVQFFCLSNINICDVQDKKPDFFSITIIVVHNMMSDYFPALEIRTS